MKPNKGRPQGRSGGKKFGKSQARYPKAGVAGVKGGVVETTDGIVTQKDELEVLAMSREARAASEAREKWQPKTELGRKVKSGEITDLQDILKNGGIISVAEIVDFIFPNIQSDLLLLGQAKGKFGGGQRRIFRQTQKKTKDGNTISFTCASACGNGDGFVGLGFGKSKETVPSKDKALRSGKLNLIMIRRGCGSWQCNCGGHHSIPYTVVGRSGGVTIKIMPAPKGKGLVINGECAKILALAGIKDVWSKVKGPTKCRLNVVKACMDALKKLQRTKLNPKFAEICNDGQLQG
ncbi:MAG: 30S ribosomal protein S5 [Candidatus Woesearchaeota archaeon]|jgi:small subunit ribosomal protein S5